MNGHYGNIFSIPQHTTPIYIVRVMEISKSQNNPALLIAADDF
jgi:hypothetical protein